MNNKTDGQEMTKGQKSADAPPRSSGASDVPVDAAPPTRRQLRLQQQQQRAGAVEETTAATVVDAPPAALNPVREGGRRDRRRRAELEARAGLQAQARNQAAAVEAIQAKASGAGPERPAGGSEPMAPVNDPATAHNLAMVTPLEFVSVPGMDRPVMKRPPTSHIPVVTSAIPVQSAKAGPGTAAGTDSGGSAAADGSVPTDDSAPIDSAGGAKPVGARSAFGLDPLDVLTAGLGRTRRLRFVSLGIGGLGILALIIAGVIIVGGSGS